MHILSCHAKCTQCCVLFKNSQNNPSNLILKIALQIVFNAFT